MSKDKEQYDVVKGHLTQLNGRDARVSWLNASQTAMLGDKAGAVEFRTTPNPFTREPETHLYHCGRTLNGAYAKAARIEVKGDNGRYELVWDARS